MLENLSRTTSSLFFCGRCLLGLCEGKEDGRCGDDLEIEAEENEVDFSLTEEFVDMFDKLDSGDWNLFCGPLKEPACLLGEICLPGEAALLIYEDLFLVMEWATTPDPLPVYNLSPMDMIITIIRLHSSYLHCSHHTASQVTRCGPGHGLRGEWDVSETSQLAICNAIDF